MLECRHMVTKTLGPFHFEDLEPHRFEDLVRNLLYDFRDWQSLEPTGRSGADDGYDARGWEVIRDQGSRTAQEVTESVDDAESPATNVRPWMIQCKRQRELGPSAVKKIVTESIQGDNPPYGFLLVAPVNFSKRAYDAFRGELRSRGVTEFYLWGKAEIEDMLLLPKNDRILFAFMGVSLVTQRRSKATGVRAFVTMKNKLSRAIADGEFPTETHESVLVRDINDTAYPYASGDPDAMPRPWREEIVTGFHPRGLLVESEKHFAYIDRVKREFDVVTTIDLVNRQSETDDRRRDWELRDLVRRFHEHVPQRNRATYTYSGLIRFNDVLAVDDKGDSQYRFPHIYVDFTVGYGPKSKRGPFNGRLQLLVAEVGPSVNLLEGEYQRVQFFPDSYDSVVKERKVTEVKMTLGEQARQLRKWESFHVYETDGKWSELIAGDVVQVADPPKQSSASESTWVKVIESIVLKASDCVKLFGMLSREELGRKLGAVPRSTAKVRVLELKPTFEPRAEG